MSVDAALSCALLHESVHWLFKRKASGCNWMSYRGVLPSFAQLAVAKVDAGRRRTDAGLMNALEGCIPSIRVGSIVWNLRGEER